MDIVYQFPDPTLEFDGSRREFLGTAPRSGQWWVQELEHFITKLVLM
jgi:hypothetical protein